MTMTAEKYRLHVADVRHPPVSVTWLRRLRAHPDAAIMVEHVVCLECGRKYRSLNKHLIEHEMVAAEYKQRWGYHWATPLMIPAVVETHRQIAERLNLGRYLPTAEKQYGT